MFYLFLGWELTSVKWGQKQLGIADKTVIDWNNYLREVCVFSMEENKNCQKIGGQESLFTKRKSNAGRVLPQQ